MTKNTTSIPIMAGIDTWSLELPPWKLIAMQSFHQTKGNNLWKLQIQEFPASDTGNNDNNEKIFNFFTRIRYEKTQCHPLYHS